MARDRRTIRAGAREETRRERGVAGRAVDATPASVKARRHIDDFFTEYDDHGDVTRARGDKKSARYKALQKLANKPDAECSKREREVKELLGMRTREEHLDDFFLRRFHHLRRRRIDVVRDELHRDFDVQQIFFSSVFDRRRRHKLLVLKLGQRLP